MFLTQKFLKLKKFGVLFLHLNVVFLGGFFSLTFQVLEGLLEIVLDFFFLFGLFVDVVFELFDLLVLFSKNLLIILRHILIGFGLFLRFLEFEFQVIFDFLGVTSDVLEFRFGLLI